MAALGKEQGWFKFMRISNCRQAQGLDIVCKAEIIN